MILFSNFFIYFLSLLLLLLFFSSLIPPAFILAILFPSFSPCVSLYIYCIHSLSGLIIVIIHRTILFQALVFFERKNPGPQTISITFSSSISTTHLSCFNFFKFTESRYLSATNFYSFLFVFCLR